MASLCYRTDYETTEGDSPAALGNRIAAAVIEYGRDDGALEEQRYVDSSFTPANDPLLVGDPGTTMRDPNAWQPLALEEQIAQNGLPIPGSVQTFIGPHWGKVTPFALPPSPDGTPIDPGPPPRLGDATSDEAFKQAALDRAPLQQRARPGGRRGGRHRTGRARRQLARGPTTGTGTTRTRSTGEPYEPHVVLRADYGRALAEYWADGPKSETPPGHWNVIANAVTDRPGLQAPARRSRRRRSISSSGTSRCTSRSTGRSTTRPSRRGASRASTTRPGRSR